MGKLLLEPSFWIAALGTAGFFYWAWSYVKAATLIADIVRANNNDPLVQKYWSQLSSRNAGYYYYPHITLTRLILTGNAAELPSDPLLLMWLNNARWAGFFCVVFSLIAVIALGLLFHILKI